MKIKFWVVLVVALGIGLLMGYAAPAGAQPVPVVVNPTTVEFDPSADHARVLSDGTAIVTRYELRMFYVGATSPFSTQDLGKPTPGTGGKITVVNATWFSAALMNTEATAKVAAIGPAGRA